VKLTIPIIPTGQARARATVRNGHAMDRSLAEQINDTVGKIDQGMG
jgi:hypothetical protein